MIFFFFNRNALDKKNKKEAKKKEQLHQQQEQFIFASVVFNLDVNSYNLSITGCLGYVLVFSCGLILLCSCLQSAAVKVLL